MDVEDPFGARAPVSPGERVAEMDVLRGVALFGVFLMNLLGYYSDGLMATCSWASNTPSTATTAGSSARSSITTSLTILTGLLLGWLAYALGRFMIGAWVGRRGWLQNAAHFLPGFRRAMGIARRADSRRRRARPRLLRRDRSPSCLGTEAGRFDPPPDQARSGRWRGLKARLPVKLQRSGPEAGTRQRIE